MSNKTISKSNAERFISAYNQIDHSLRTIYGFKRSISYADLIRKAVPLNSVVRKFEDELIDYGRLRNSIVHKTNPNYVIAEPHIEVVEDFEKIAKIISTPPTAYDKVCKKDVITCRSDINIKNLLELMVKYGYKNIPIFEDNTLKGVVIGASLLDNFGNCLLNNVNLDEFSRSTAAIEVATFLHENSYFTICDKRLTIEKALNYFYLNRKLQMIIITEKGTSFEPLLGVITIADILDMNAIIENYQ